MRWVWRRVRYTAMRFHGGGRATQSTARHAGSTVTCRGCRGCRGCWASSKAWYGLLEVARREEEKSLARRSHRPAERPGTCAANHSPTRGSIDGNAPEDPLDYSRRWRTPAVASLPRRAVAVLVQLCSDGDGKHSPRPGVAGLPGSHEVGRAFLTDTWRKNIGLLAACQLRSTSGAFAAAAPCPLARITTPRVRRGST